MFGVVININQRQPAYQISDVWVDKSFQEGVWRKNDTVAGISHHQWRDIHTWAVLTAAPNPVQTPHPRRQTLSRGAAGSILATSIWFITVYCEKVLVPINCRIFFPLQVNRDSVGAITSCRPADLKREVTKIKITSTACVASVQQCQKLKCSVCIETNQQFENYTVSRNNLLNSTFLWNCYCTIILFAHIQCFVWYQLDTA